jgi:hypothetical protein
MIGSGARFAAGLENVSNISPRLGRTPGDCRGLQGTRVDKTVTRSVRQMAINARKLCAITKLGS